MRTQNPPPLKACRFDSDLGHQLSQRLIALAGAYLQRARRIGLSMRELQIAPAKALTHSLHIKSAADVPEVGINKSSQMQKYSS